MQLKSNLICSNIDEFFPTQQILFIKYQIQHELTRHLNCFPYALQGIIITYPQFKQLETLS
ncbi:unnamed protein product [Paramecium octaurelia]|uniref:Uncharacterized protein n=1 Tax=Paramecium octaurelia TaxID=43137 RepID=A0A8S1YQL1_PAROT|nr:unnamed protein product [Paramecium octaurelia]